MLYLGDHLDAKKNNFDFMRMIAALMVAFSHSYPLATGPQHSEPLEILTNGQIGFGSLGVAIFFVMSGFLVSKSFINRISVLGFLKARFFRLFPGLLVVTLLTVFILGPVVTVYPIKDYWLDSKILYYLRNISIFWIQNYLPGVFVSNAYPSTVNGSLWTIPYEAKAYLILLLTGLLGIYKRGYMVGTLFIFSLLSDSQFMILFRYFAAGMLFFQYRNRIPIKKEFFIASLFIVVLSSHYSIMQKILPFFGGYVFLYLCLNTAIPLTKFGAYGDFSYGTYIYAFPVQQLVTHYHGGVMLPWDNFIISIPIILTLAILSWHLIERPFLKFKNSNTLSRSNAMNM